MSGGDIEKGAKASKSLSFQDFFASYFLRLFGDSLSARFSNFLLASLFGSFALGTSAIIYLYEEDLASRADVEVAQKSKVILSRVRDNDTSSHVSLKKSIQGLLSQGQDGITGDFYIYVDRNHSNSYFPVNVDRAIKSGINHHFSLQKQLEIHQHVGHVLSFKNGLGEDIRFELRGGAESADGSVYYAKNITYEANRVANLLSVSLVYWFVAFVVFKLLCDLVSRELTRPIKRLTEKAEVVDVNNLDDLIISTNEMDPIEIHQTAYAFNGLADRLRVSINQQKSFASVVSHELRTPLSLVTGYTSRLRRDYASFPVRAKKSADKLKEEVELMSHLVDSLLEITKLDANINPPLLVETSLNDLIRDAVEGIESAVHRTIKLHIPTERVKVKTDPAKLKHILLNLCENAAKYSEDHTKIEIDLALSVGGFAVVSVRDQGIGIKSEELPYIFDRFYRSASARSSGVSGSGLGLSIVKALVQSLGATIRASSEVGKGSEFEIVWAGSSCEGS